MAKQNWRSLESTLRTLIKQLDDLERRSERMELILMVREPGSAAAADAYEGLRKSVVAGVTDRLVHMTQLVQFDAALQNGADEAVLRAMVAGWVESAGLRRVDDPGAPEAELLYELIEDEGGELVVVDPAYVDSVSNRLIRQGRARRLAPRVVDSPPVEETEATDDSATGAGDRAAATIGATSEKAAE